MAFAPPARHLLRARDLADARYQEPIGVERTVSATTEALAVSGRVDRVDDRGDELVVVDYKTGRRGLTDDDERRGDTVAG